MRQMLIVRVVVAVLFAVSCLLASPVAAEAQRQRGPVFSSIVLHSADEVPQEVIVEIFRINSRGQISSRPQQSLTVSLDAFGNFRWERARFGKAYFVRVTNIAFQTHFQQTYVPLRDFEGYAIVMSRLTSQKG